LASLKKMLAGEYPPAHEYANPAQFSAEYSPRSPDMTIRIFSTVEYFFRVSRRMVLI
jgi:hypothetical protein